MVSPERERLLGACALKVCREMGAELLAIGGMPDHLHLLVRLPSTLAVADLVKRVKGSSARLIQREDAASGPFRWQKSYAAFSVSRWDAGRVQRYIRKQKEHHGEGRTSRKLEHLEEE